MYSVWTAHLDTEEEKEKFTKEIQGSRRVLDRLQLILENNLKSLESSEEGPKAFDEPNWDYKQAYRNGARYSIKSMLKLTNLDQQKVIQ